MLPVFWEYFKSVNLMFPENFAQNVTNIMIFCHGAILHWKYEIQEELTF